SGPTEWWHLRHRDASHRLSVTSRRQLLGINMDQGRLHQAFMGHHGQMHAQPGVGTRPGTPVQVEAGEDVAPAPEPLDSDRPEQRYLPATSFRSRRSALSGAQRQTWERRWPELGISETPRRAEPLDTRAWFGREAPVVLEIGCGSGTSTLPM